MGEILSVRVEDISSEGAYLQTEPAYLSGAVVRLRMTLEIGKVAKRVDAGYVQLLAHGKVVRVEPGGIAVRFNKARLQPCGRI